MTVSLPAENLTHSTNHSDHRFSPPTRLISWTLGHFTDIFVLVLIT